jgi:hypothetical protein
MTTTAFTPEDVAALAELVRPHIAADGDIEAAVALAAATDRDDFERRISMAWRLAGAMSGSYDLFRAEAGL